MTDHTSSGSGSSDPKEVADESLDADIADESAAYKKAQRDDDADDVVAEGHWKSTNDGSGTSETDKIQRARVAVEVE